MYRQERIADLLQTFLAEEIRRLMDPRLEFVTVTEVRPRKDLKSAKVYWCVPAEGGADGGTPQFPDEAQCNRVAEALQSTKSFLKKRIGEELKLRYVPDLIFTYDQSAQTGSRIDELLKQAGFPNADTE